ncbi:MAG: SOS response-associated peptidase [Massilia sp.]
MCGRFDQNDINRLIQNFEWAQEVFNRSQAEGRYNVAPGTVRPLLHMEGEALFLDDVYWGYRSAWAQASGKLPMAINTRLEKINNRYWISMLRRGRAVVPAAGWYEWTGEKGSKQPWHIHRADGSPLFMAALAHFGAPAEHPETNGFTIVTADAGGGLLDVHDRRPVVLDARDVPLWLDPATPAEQAEHLLRAVALGPDSFAWHQVDRALGNVRNDGPQVAAPSQHAA